MLEAGWILKSVAEALEAGQAEFIDVIGRFPGFRAFLAAKVKAGEFDVMVTDRCFFGHLGAYLRPGEPLPFSYGRRIANVDRQYTGDLEYALMLQPDRGIALLTTWLEVPDAPA